MTITKERPVKKMPPHYNRENPAGLKVEVGPDQRLRLVLDRSAVEGSRHNVISINYLARSTVESLAGDSLNRFTGEDFDY